MFLCIGIDKDTSSTLLPVLVPRYVAENWRRSLSQPPGATDSNDSAITCSPCLVDAAMNMSEDQITRIIVHNRRTARAFWCVFRVKGSACNLNELLVPEGVIAPIRALIHTDKKFNRRDAEEFRTLGNQITLKTSLVVSFNESFFLCWPSRVDLIKELANGFFL